MESNRLIETQIVSFNSSNPVIQVELISTDIKSTQIEDRRLEGLLLFFGSAFIWTGYLWYIGAVGAAQTAAQISLAPNSILETSSIPSAISEKASDRVIQDAVDLLPRVFDVLFEKHLNGKMHDIWHSCILRYGKEYSEANVSRMLNECYPVFLKNLPEFRSFFKETGIRILTELLEIHKHDITNPALEMVFEPKIFEIGCVFFDYTLCWTPLFVYLSNHLINGDYTKMQEIVAPFL